MYKRQGKIAVVTGGTRGIGYAIVRKYLENGAKVVLFGSREETVDKALNKLTEENPDWEVSGDHPNLSDAKEVEAAIERVKEKFGRIAILVNNAGISQSTKLDVSSTHLDVYKRQSRDISRIPISAGD